MDAALATPSPTRLVLPAGAVDCDIHPPLPAMAELLPHMDAFWQDSIVARGIASPGSIAWPDNAPLTQRPDWRDADGAPGGSVERMRRDALDRWGIGTAILNPLIGVNLLYDLPMATMFARAVNDWIAATWLDRDRALRASIVVNVHDAEAAVAEIERRAPDRRFVQVLFPAMAETPYGRKSYWPIYAAAVRHRLPIGIHAGSTYRHAVTAIGWPSHYVEDYVAQSQGFQSQLASLVSEGAFARFPELKVVLLESGVAWLPAFLWRFAKFWRGLRTEVPWVDRSPAEIVRDHIRMTVQPFDAPDAAAITRVLDHIGSDELLLFSTDYPHWQFDGDDIVPPGIDAGLLARIAVENPARTYPRLAVEAT